MGQRSQIYVRYEENGVKQLVARYYGWNFGERMISRARYGMEWIKENIEYPWNMEKNLYRILDTNFDMIDCVKSTDILKEFIDNPNDWRCAINNFVFQYQDNNDGYLLIDILTDGTMKYGFLKWDCITDKVMSATEYLNWDTKSWKSISCDLKNWESKFEGDNLKKCKKNVKEISKLAKKMTSEEAQEFIFCDYSHLFPKLFTWDQLYKRAIGTACGSPELNAKDNARFNIANMASKDGISIEDAEIPEEAIEDYIEENGEIYFDEDGNVL